MSSEAPLTTAQVEDGFAYNEWDVDTQEEEAPRRERFRLWHAAELRRVKGVAWDEGYQACHDDYQRDTGPLLTPNPYRDRADQIEEDQP